MQASLSKCLGVWFGTGGERWGGLLRGVLYRGGTGSATPACPAIQICRPRLRRTGWPNRWPGRTADTGGLLASLASWTIGSAGKTGWPKLTGSTWYMSVVRACCPYHWISSSRSGQGLHQARVSRSPVFPAGEISIHCNLQRLLPGPGVRGAGSPAASLDKHSRDLHP